MMQATPPRIFESSVPAALAPSDPPAAPVAAPRIYYVPLAMVDDPGLWGTILDACAGMGFDTVLISPPGDPGPSGNMLLPFDDMAAHPALASGAPRDEAVAALAGACRERGLALMVDVVADRISGGGPLAGSLGIGGLGRDARDPRVAPEDRGAVALSFTGEDAGLRVIACVTASAARLAKAGVAGFRCLRPHRVPAPVWMAIGDALRQERPDGRLLAWTPGLGAEDVAGLAPAGFDGAFSSLRWWNGRAAWGIEDYERLSGLGPVVAFPEAPFGDRLIHPLVTDELAERLAVQALWRAASLGDGLLIPMGFEFGASEPVAPTGGAGSTYATLRDRPRLDLAARVRAANDVAARGGAKFERGAMRILTGAAAPATVVLRTDAADLRAAEDREDRGGEPGARPFRSTAGRSAVA